MNQTIRATKVLDYYDGVLVFTGQDFHGWQYVGSIIDTTDTVDRYLVKGLRRSGSATWKRAGLTCAVCC